MKKCGLDLAQVFHKRMPPEAVDLVSRLLQYSPNLRCTAVSGCVSLRAFHFSLQEILNKSGLHSREIVFAKIVSISFNETNL